MSGAPVPSLFLIAYARDSRAVRGRSEERSRCGARTADLRPQTHVASLRCLTPSSHGGSLISPRRSSQLRGRQAPSVC